MILKGMLMQEFDIQEIESTEANYVLKTVLKKNRKEIKDFLERKFPGIDFETYEDGIDSWWGMTSVFSYELGLVLTIKIIENIIIIGID